MKTRSYHDSKKSNQGERERERERAENSSLKFHRHPARSNNTTFSIRWWTVCCETFVAKPKGDSHSRASPYQPSHVQIRWTVCFRMKPRTFCIFDERVARVQTESSALSSFHVPCLVRVFSIVPPFGTRSGIIDDRSTPRAAIVPRFTPPRHRRFSFQFSIALAPLLFPLLFV